MRLIRLFFWLVTTVIVAYFLTDINIAGKTLKQHIDGFLHSQTGQEVKTKAANVLTNLEKLAEQPSSKPGPAEPAAAKSPEKTSPEVKKNVDTQDELTRKDEHELKKIIKTNQ